MKFALRVSTAVAAGLLVSGCAGVLAHKGSVLDPQLASAIQPGVDNKASVEKLLGRPSFVGQFTPNDWYYVSRDTKSMPLRGVGVIDQTILHVRFDPAGNVATVARTGKEYIASIDPVDAKTPTLGRKRSFFEELFGNISSINSPGMPGASRPQ